MRQGILKNGLRGVQAGSSSELCSSLIGPNNRVSSWTNCPRWVRWLSTTSGDNVAPGGPVEDKNELKRRVTRVLSSKTLGRTKPRILVIGSGWGGFKFCNEVDKKKYDVHVVSPSNHFLFTPLLPSSVVGTLEYRAIQEPIRTIRGLGQYYQAKAKDIDFDTRKVLCEEIFRKTPFWVEYDYLILACGAKTNTFGTPGVTEAEIQGKDVFFLKHLYHARQIRNRILECFERASVHLTEPAERDRLLTFVVVGGGPTNCELVGELRDFIKVDVSKWYPDLVKHIQIYLVERGPRLLGSFDPTVSEYAMKRFDRYGIKVKLGVAVESWDKSTKTVHLSDGTHIPTGLMVWSAGLQMTRFVDEGLPQVKHGPGNRIVVDDYQKVDVRGFEDRVYAIGDCCINLREPLAPLAQSAAQQASYLAKAFNEAPDGVGLTRPASDLQQAMNKPFKYFSLGSMVTLGAFRGAVDFSQVGHVDKPKNFGLMYGILSYLMWRSAYLSKQNSWTNRALIPMYWFKSWLLGRDISRF